jgi:hypothetical protein
VCVGVYACMHVHVCVCICMFVIMCMRRSMCVCVCVCVAVQCPPSGWGKKDQKLHKDVLKFFELETSILK